MNLGYTDEERAFREEVRAFVAERLPDDIRRKVRDGEEALVKDDYYRWHRELHQRGWVAPGWPRRYGGTGWTPVQRHIFAEESAYGWAPRLLPFGLQMVAPVIINFGDDAQRERYLPAIASGEEFWCQGYSEPGSGSDLASLQTRAERPQARRDLVHPGRHADARDQRAADRHHRRRRGDQRGALRERRGARREPRRRGGRRLEMRDVPARVRAHRDRGHPVLPA